MYHYRTYRKKKTRKTGKIVAVIVSMLLVLLVVLITKTLLYPFYKFEPIEFTEQVDTTVSDEAVQRLTDAIRIPTISEDILKTADNPFDRFKAFLPQAFPRVYQSMDTLSINTYGMLFRWKGKDSTRNPILFLAHYDVVPVAGYNSVEEPIRGWDFPPFSGTVANGRVYGRGSLDMKSMLMAQMEAASTLLVDSFQPEQDIWFAYGFDEESGGTNGALKMAEYFKEHNITFDAVYDEGSVVVAPGIAGVSRPVALVGVAEKGVCTLHIIVKSIGGHSSMPPRKSSLVLAAEIIQKLNNNQFPAQIISPVQSFMNHVGGSMGFLSQMALANRWLLERPLIYTLEKNPTTNALVRTTSAVTMVKGSDAPNVLSTTATITANYRILTGESVQEVIDHVKSICADYDVEIEVVSAREPSKLSTEDSRAFRAVRNSITKFYPEASVASYISLTSTDAYKYESVSNYVYRIIPIYLNEDEQRTIHNENEYITLENYGKMIAYFKEIMKTFETTD